MICVQLVYVLVQYTTLFSSIIKYSQFHFECTIIAATAGVFIPSSHSSRSHTDTSQCPAGHCWYSTLEE